MLYFVFKHLLFMPSSGYQVLILVLFPLMVG